jgi:hypothetical protein
MSPPSSSFLPSSVVFLVVSPFSARFPPLSPPPPGRLVPSFPSSWSSCPCFRPSSSSSSRSLFVVFPLLCLAFFLVVSPSLRGPPTPSACCPCLASPPAAHLAPPPRFASCPSSFTSCPSSFASCVSSFASRLLLLLFPISALPPLLPSPPPPSCLASPRLAPPPAPPFRLASSSRILFVWPPPRLARWVARFYSAGLRRG